MAQETELCEQETHREAVNTRERKKDESMTGRDMPGGDGGVGDEQVHAIGDDGRGGPLGQDHSMDDHEQQDPDDGVGAIQDREDRTSGVADISD